MIFSLQYLFKGGGWFMETLFWKLCAHTVKKRLPIFPSPVGMSLTKLSLAGNVDGKIVTLFLQCSGNELSCLKLTQYHSHLKISLPQLLSADKHTKPASDIPSMTCHAWWASRRVSVRRRAWTRAWSWSWILSRVRGPGPAAQNNSNCFT